MPQDPASSLGVGSIDQSLARRRSPITPAARLRPRCLQQCAYVKTAAATSAHRPEAHLPISAINEPQTFRQTLGAGLGSELRTARGSRGLRSTARELGISHGYLSLLEHGKRAPSLKVAWRLCEVLELNPGAKTKLIEIAGRVDAGQAERMRERALNHGVGG
jgi:DNA-binding XRE family transcriptional regulator